eukprot:40838-Eustigmatos_ZCMA.PRE.1
MFSPLESATDGSGSMTCVADALDINTACPAKHCDEECDPYYDTHTRLHTICMQMSSFPFIPMPGSAVYGISDQPGG